MSLNNEKGVTLIEVIIVLVIISILASLTAVGPGFIRNDNISRASRELYGDLHKVRQDALTRSSSANSLGWGIRFATPTTYTIFELFKSDDNNNYYEEKNPPRNLSSSIEYQINGVNPNNDVLIFDKLGIPRTDTGTLWPNDITLVIRHKTDNQVQAKCINISTNRIREGLWDGSNCQEQ